MLCVSELTVQNWIFWPLLGIWQAVGEISRVVGLFAASCAFLAATGEWMKAAVLRSFCCRFRVRSWAAPDGRLQKWPQIPPFPEWTPLCNVTLPFSLSGVESLLHTLHLGLDTWFVLINGMLTEAWRVLVLWGLLSLAASGILRPLMLPDLS